MFSVKGPFSGGAGSREAQALLQAARVDVSLHWVCMSLYVNKTQNQDP